MSAIILITCKMSVWPYAFPNMPNFGQGNALLYAFPSMPCVLVFSMHYTMFPVLVCKHIGKHVGRTQHIHRARG